MRLLLAAVLLLSACGPRTGAVRTGEPGADVPTAKPIIPAAPEVRIPDDANAIVVFSEAVGDPEKDYAAYAKVYVDNAPAGQTQLDAKSKPKRWGAKLPLGNRLFRFEAWFLPPSGDWQMLDPQWQPAERFVRLLDGQRTVVTLKLLDGGIKHDLQITREPLR